MNKQYKKILDNLDIQYKNEVYKETGLTFAGEVSDTARLYRLIEKYLNLEKDFKHLLKAGKDLRAAQKKYMSDRRNNG